MAEVFTMPLQNAATSVAVLIEAVDSACTAMESLGIDDVSICTDTSACETLDSLIASLKLARSRIETLHSRAQKHRECMWANISTVRNSNAPINRDLPPEILGHVFQTLANSFAPTRKTKGRKIVRWTPVMLVCRRWREVALGTPTLWATAADGTSQWIQRAAGVPLNLSVSKRESFAVVEPHCWHLRELHAVAQDIKWLRFLNAAAPSLVDLSIVTPDFLDEDAREGLPILFAGQLPKLRHLTIGGFSKLAGNRFCNLTRISLKDVSYSSQGGKSISQVYNMLSASPRLRDLEMVSARLSYDLIQTPPPTRCISLPVLEHIELRDCSTNLIRAIMRPLNLLASGIHVKCTSSQAWNRHDIMPIDSYLPAHIRFAAFRDATAVQLHCGSSVASVRALKHSTSSEVYLEYSSWQPPEELASFVASIRDVNFAFHALQELWLSGDNVNDVEWWRGLFGGLSSLTKLVIESDSHSEPSMRWFQALKNATVAGLYPVPSLLELLWLPVFLDEVLMDALTEVVAARHRSGHRLRRLKIMRDPESSGWLREHFHWQFRDLDEFRIQQEKSADVVEWSVITQRPTMHDVADESEIPTLRAA